MILVDANIFIAAIYPLHVHHNPSSLFLAVTPPTELAVAAAALCEVYNHLTRPPPRYNLAPEVVHAAIEQIARQMRVLQMPPPAMLDAMRRFAERGGRGARLYDFLIGMTGEASGIQTIATWNVRDFAPMFPHLRVATPMELAP